MCTASGKCVDGCPKNGERTDRDCLCSSRDLDLEATGETWCGPGYACDHRTGTCALYVCPNSDGSSELESACVCTGTTVSEVCVKGTYCMSDALSFSDDGPLTLCQTKCENDGGSMISTACALRENFRIAPPTVPKSLREVGLGCMDADNSGGKLCKAEYF